MADDRFCVKFIEYFDPFRKHYESSRFLNIEGRRNCYKPFGSSGKIFRKCEVSSEKIFDSLVCPVIVEGMKTPTTQEVREMILWLFSTETQYDETPAMAKRRYEVTNALLHWARLTNNIEAL